MVTHSVNGIDKDAYVNKQRDLASFHSTPNSVSEDRLVLYLVFDMLNFVPSNLVVFDFTPLCCVLLVGFFNLVRCRNCILIKMSLSTVTLP